MRSTIKKGKLVELQKLQTTLKLSLNYAQSLYLRSQQPLSKKTSSQQYSKHIPQFQSLESFELYLQRDKLSKAQDIPGTGSYELPSVFKQSESRVQPFEKQQGRTKYIHQEETVGVGLTQYLRLIHCEKSHKVRQIFQNVKYF